MSNDNWHDDSPAAVDAHFARRKHRSDVAKSVRAAGLAHSKSKASKYIDANGGVVAVGAKLGVPNTRPVLGGNVPLFGGLANTKPANVTHGLKLVSTIDTAAERRQAYTMSASKDVLSVKYVPVEIDGKAELKLVGVDRLRPE